MRSEFEDGAFAARAIRGEVRKWVRAGWRDDTQFTTIAAILGDVTSGPAFAEAAKFLDELIDDNRAATAVRLLSLLRESPRLAALERLSDLKRRLVLLAAAMQCPGTDELRKAILHNCDSAVRLRWYTKVIAVAKTTTETTLHQMLAALSVDDRPTLLIAYARKVLWAGSAAREVLGHLRARPGIATRLDGSDVVRVLLHESIAEGAEIPWLDQIEPLQRCKALAEALARGNHALLPVFMAQLRCKPEVVSGIALEHTEFLVSSASGVTQLAETLVQAMPYMTVHQQAAVLRSHECLACLLVDAQTWRNMLPALRITALKSALGFGISLEKVAKLAHGLEEGVVLNLGDRSAGSRMRFNRFHEEFQRHVVELAWDVDTPLDLDAFLPTCSRGESNVRYCEGRPWRDDVAFCPRLRGPCQIRSRGVGYARLFADDLPPEKWTLLELFKSTGILTGVPLPDGLRNPVEYVPRLAGWINRLSEIRERLRCSVCSQAMTPNFKYAKHLARYNATVVSCRTQPGHDHDVYLNHCWGCESGIIDSRNNRVRIEKFYLCLKCGSGPKQSASFAHGDICPACGQRQMERREDREYQCTRCRHSIRTPPAWKTAAFGDEAPGPSEWE